MKSKFTVTAADEKYMDSIDKSYKKSTRLKVENKSPKTKALSSKLVGVKVGQGKSYHSGKRYKHA